MKNTTFALKYLLNTNNNVTKGYKTYIIDMQENVNQVNKKI